MTGIICINKDKGITSFGVVAKCRGILHEKKAGHTGTLDPMATGVLPIMLGGATRFLNYLPDSDKGYRASLLLGKTTDTLDITGNVLRENEVNVNREDFLSALDKFRGAVMQTPPMYSAKSVDGVRLYDLARQGVEVERKPCRVEIKSLTLVENKGNEYVIDVLCSKGTYIRSLIDDIGRELGCGAVMTELVRTKAMGFTLDDCVSLDDLQSRRDSNPVFDDLLKSVEEMFCGYRAVTVSEAQSKRFANGGELDINRVRAELDVGELCRVYSNDSNFLGLGQRDGETLRVARLLTKRD